MIDIPNLISILTAISCVLGLYWNSKKFGDEIKKETEWRSGVNNDMRNLIEKITTLLESQRETNKIVHDLIEFKLKQTHSNEEFSRQFSALWKRIDELKAKE